MQKLTFRQRMTAVLLISLFFALGYGILGFMPHYASLDGSTFIDDIIPFVPWFVIFYMLGTVYLFIPLFVLDETFDYAVKGFFVLMVVAFLCFLILPIEISYAPIDNEGFSAIVQGYRTHDTRFNTFPSLHVAFTFYAWLLLRGRNLFLWTAPIALGIILSVLFIKSHLFIDFIGGLLLGAGVAFRSELSILRSLARVR